MSRFINNRYSKLIPYTPGEQPQVARLIKLNTNESPFPPSPEVIKAIDSKEVEKLNLYPDPEANVLIEAISESYGIAKSRIVVGNGSDELLAFSFMIFQGENREIYFPDISYGFYKVYAEVYGAAAKLIPLDDDLMINPKDYFNLGETIVIANPNPPTGSVLSLESIEEILKANKDNLVIIDEAYVNFGAESSLKLIDKYDNLLVIQTFSKDRNLAGARIGMAFAQEEIIKDLNKIRYSFNPYNLNRLSILAGAAAMKDKKYFEDCMEKIKETRRKFVKDMEALGFSIKPSLANFVLAKHDKISGAEYYESLKRKNILVRHFDNVHIKDYVRITIGAKEDMDTLVKVTKELLEANN